MSVATLVQLSQYRVPKEIFADYPRNERALLLWFAQFAASGKMEAHVVDGQIYYWLRQPYVQEKLPQFFPSSRSVMWTLCKLSGKVRSQAGGKERTVADTTGQHPLECRTIWTRKGKKSLYRFREDSMKKLIQADGAKTFKLEKKQNRKLCPEVIGILELALSLPMKGNPEKMLFTNQWSGDPWLYTNTIRHISDYLHEIHEGRFARTKLNLIPEWYVEQTGFDREAAAQLVLAAKGDWVKVAALVKSTIRNFRFSYDEDRYPMDKKNLPKSLATFLWRMVGNGGVSSFLVCVPGKPELSDRPKAEEVFQSIPEDIRNFAYPLYTVGGSEFEFNMYEYWSKIRDVYRWGAGFYEKHRQSAGVNYWFSGGVLNWFAGYVEWLRGWCTILQLSNLGVGNRTWTTYLSMKISEHSMNESIIASWDKHCKAGFLPAKAPRKS